MGIRVIPAKMPGRIPTFYVTDTIQEDAGGGNVCIWNYARINGVLVPQFQCIIASCKLLPIGRNIVDFAKDVFDSEQLRLPGTHVH